MVRTTFLLTTLAAVAAFHPKIDESLHRGLRDGDVNDVMIVLKKKTTTRRRLEDLHPRDRNRGGKIQSRMKQMAREAADNSQSVLSVLEAAKTRNPRSSRSVFQSRQDAMTYNSHWITNSISAKAVTEDVLKTLADLDDVEMIRAPKVIPMAKPIHQTKPMSFQTTMNETVDEIVGEAIRRIQNGENQWGIQKIEAPRTWESFNRGEGVVIAGIDTGVRGTSMFLRNSYVGAENFGWYDPYMKTSEPTDYDLEFGHGTHTMGTMVGSNGIGVAPEAKWMACTACDSGSCYEEELIACAEFMACPHDTTGNNADCSKAPFIINNSWGGPGGDSFYQDVVDTWRSFGIIPVFANGNSGPSCGTADSPGDYANVIAVGSTTVNDAISEFSSKGPGPSGLVKPDISAPGDVILSASGVGDEYIAVSSGTSMAAPHVSGMIALMLSADDTRVYDDVFTAISSSSETSTLISSGMTCGGTTDTTFPNNIFGHGRINAYHTLAGQTVPTSAPVPLSPTLVPTPAAPTPAPAPDDASAGQGPPDSPVPAPTPVPVPAPAPVTEESPVPTPAPVSADVPTPSPKTPEFEYSDKVDELLQRYLGPTNFIFVYVEKGDQVAEEPKREDFESRGDWLTARVEHSKAQAAADQATVLALLNQYSGAIQFKSYWISPRVSVYFATPELIYQLDQLDQVTRIVSL